MTKNIFRQESLERLSSPERLNQLMQVVKPKDWLPLTTLGLLVLLAIIWSLVGRVAVTVTGRGIILDSEQVKHVLGSSAVDTSSTLVNVSYLAIGDGKQVKPGMKALITPDTVKREQFGSIVGMVTHVVAFPVTRQSAAKLIGNADLATLLISQSGTMQIVTQLKPDCASLSGYRWTSQTNSTHQQLSAGITTSVKVIVAQEAPIEFVFPLKF